MRVRESLLTKVRREQEMKDRRKRRKKERKIIYREQFVKNC